MGVKEVRPDAPPVPAAMLRKVEKICAALPETSCQQHPQVVQFNVRRRTFVHVLAPPDAEGRPIPMLIVRPDPLEREALVAIGHPYFATRGSPRIGVVLTKDTDWSEMAELITESYRLVAPKKLADLLP